MNTQQDHELTAKKIAALLDQSAREIDTATAAKLLEARKEALAHFQDKPARSWVPELSAAAGGRIEGAGPNMRMGLALLAFLASLAGIVAWHSMGQQGSEIADIDTALLTDELPINTFLDKGFEAWVKRP
jgi:hypothetical protein